MSLGGGGATVSDGEAGTRPTVTFRVLGTPKPKGSLRHVGGGRIVEQVNNAAWRQLVTESARHSMMGRTPLAGPLRADLTFILDRPKTSKRTSPHVRSAGDLDKLIRLGFDAMNKIVYVDDAQVIQLTASKTYGTNPGVFITIWEVTET